MATNSNFRQNSILILTAVLIGACALLSLVIVPALSKQGSSDCDSSQTHNASTKRCETAVIEEEAEKKEQEAAKSKAKLEDEARIGKQTGTICLNTSEAWHNVGKTTCVVYHPNYLFRTDDGYLFLDEKEDYKTGFVAFFVYKNMLSWDDFLARYQDVDFISVYGQITMYEGHPQIKVHNLDQVTTPRLVNCETSYGCIFTRGS